MAYLSLPQRRRVHRVLLAATFGVTLGGIMIVGHRLPAASAAQTVAPSAPSSPPAAAPVAGQAPVAPTTPPLTPTPAAPNVNVPAAAPANPPVTPPAATIDPAARTIIEQIAAAQMALNSYSATIDSQIQQASGPVSQHGVVSFQKPNKAYSEVTTPDKVKHTFVSDGSNMFAVDSAAPKSYAKKEASAGVAGIADIVGFSQASPSGILPLMISSGDASSVVLKGATSLTKAPDDTLDGVPVDVVQILATSPSGEPFTVTVSAGKTDHLLRRLNIAHGLGADAKTQVMETYTGVQANPTLPASTFVFTPAPGATVAVEPPMFDPRVKVGAKPLPFSGKDLSGKTLNLAAYKGKVVLLDFWATWCTPCLEELPNVVSAYHTYHPKGFNVIGISLDRAGDRAKMINLAHSLGMPWPQIYDGKDFQGALPKVYGVQAIPFSVLIGKDGKIAAVDPHGEDLAPAVKAALAK